MMLVPPPLPPLLLLLLDLFLTVCPRQSLPVTGTDFHPQFTVLGPRMIKVSFKDSFRIENWSEVVRLELLDGNQTVRGVISKDDLQEELEVPVELDACESHEVSGRLITRRARHSRTSEQGSYSPDWGSLSNIKQLINSSLCLEGVEVVTKIRMSTLERENNSLFSNCFQQLEVCHSEGVSGGGRCWRVDSSLGPVRAGTVTVSMLMGSQGGRQVVFQGEGQQLGSRRLCEAMSGSRLAWLLGDLASLLTVGLPVLAISLAITCALLCRVARGQGEDWTEGQIDNCSRGQGSEPEDGPMQEDSHGQGGGHLIAL